MVHPGTGHPQVLCRASLMCCWLDYLNGTDCYHTESRLWHAGVAICPQCQDADGNCSNTDEYVCTWQDYVTKLLSEQHQQYAENITAEAAKRRALMQYVQNLEVRNMLSAQAAGPVGKPF